MIVRVSFFARARDLVGSPSVELDLPDHADIAVLRRELASNWPLLAPLVPTLLFAVADDYALDHVPLSAGVTVSCFPPVSGG